MKKVPVGFYLYFFECGLHLLLLPDVSIKANSRKQLAWLKDQSVFVLLQ